MIEFDALSPEKRAQILRGAAVVFDHDGYEGASMSRIAKEANVSKGTLYNHFESKADLFSAYLEQALSRQYSHIFEHVAEADGLEEALTSIGRCMMDLLLTPQRRSLYRMVISEAESFPELARAFYDAGPKVALATMSGWIATQVAAGRLAVDDAGFAADQFFALCQTLTCMRYRLFLQQEPCKAEIDQVVHGAVKTFLARYRVMS